MKVKEARKLLAKMNPEQELVVAIDETKESGNCTSQYIPVDFIAQTAKHAVIEITY